MRKLFKIVIFALGFVYMQQFCHKQTNGFAMVKVCRLFINASENHIPSAPLNQRFLNQRFFFFTQGGQSYIFLSEDGKYVLKFFRASRLDFLYLFNRFFPISWAKKNIVKQEGLLKKTLQSYLLAEAKLKLETGLVRVHLSQALVEKSKIKIVDKIGVEHLIDLRLYPFILQKKILPVKGQIEKFMQKGKIDDAKEALKNLFSFLSMRIDAGIQDKDPNLTKNFGFIGKRVVEFDAGNFTIGPPTFERIISSKIDLQYWLDEHYPQLSKDFDDYFQEFMRKYENF